MIHSLQHDMIVLCSPRSGSTLPPPTSNCADDDDDDDDANQTSR